MDIGALIVLVFALVTLVLAPFLRLFCLFFSMTTMSMHKATSI